MKIAAAALLFVMATLVGCAATPATDEGSATSGQAESGADASAAFAIDYSTSDSAAGILVRSGSFDSISSDDLMTTLPEGDATAAAQCLSARNDSMHGDTLAGLTWTYNHETYYVLTVALDDMQGLTDLHMVFVYAADGSSAFQALTWDGKKNVKLTSGKSACPSS